MQYNWSLVGNAIVNSFLRKSWDATQMSFDYFEDVFMPMPENDKWQFLMEQFDQLQGQCVCPRCRYAFDPRRKALSRLSSDASDENAIWVCSSCGTEEALLQWHNNGVAVDWREEK